MDTKEWSKEELEFLKNNYLELSNEDIAKNIGRTKKAIQVKLSKMGLVRPDKYYYDKRFFENINREDKAYWLGFLYADGYVHITDRNAETGIELSAIDIDHLKKFNKSLKGNITPTIRKERNGIIKSTYGIASFRLYSRQMAQDLISHGCIENKTFYIEFPEFNESKLTWAFIRGYFDGDGSMYRDVGRKFIGFSFTCGSQKFLQGLRDFLYKEGIYGYLSEEQRKDERFHKTSMVYKLLITGLNNAYSFGEKLYNEANIYLDRKKVKYTKAVQEYSVKERTQNRPYRK